MKSSVVTRALGVLVLVVLSVVLVGRGYASCIDYWNSRQYRPDTVGALSLCVREDPLPMVIALFVGVVAVGFALRARPGVGAS